VRIRRIQNSKRNLCVKLSVAKIIHDKREITHAQVWETHAIQESKFVGTRKLLRQTDQGSTAHARIRKQEKLHFHNCVSKSQIETKDKDGTLNLYKIG